MPRFNDDPYDAWGQDQRISEEERAYWEEMTPGATDEYHRPVLKIENLPAWVTGPGVFDSTCTACGRDLAAQECCVACGDDQ